VQIERELYATSEQRLLERLRAVEDDVESLMLIGHNPGVEQLAHRSGRQRAEPGRPPPQVPDRRARDARGPSLSTASTARRIGSQSR
jgi:phosphohistidine phosphatase SixA